MRHLEAFQDNALASLKVQLPQRIAIINQEFSDFVLPTPDADNYYAGGLSTFLKYPSVEVAAPDWALNDPSLGQRHWEGTVTITTRILHQHPEFEILYRACMRYSRCLTESLAQPDMFGAGQTVTSMRGFLRVNPETGEREEFIAGALVVCTLDVIEGAP